MIFNITITRAFRKALDAMDFDKVRELCTAHPGLVEQHPWPNRPQTALQAFAGVCVGIRPEYSRTIRVLLDCGARCDFVVAARAGLLDMVTTMMRRTPGAMYAVDEWRRTALYRATCIYGRFSPGEAVADYLMSEGAMVDIHSAATLGMLERVREFLRESKEPPVGPGPEGMSALHWAVRPRRQPQNAKLIVECLLEKGASVDLPNPMENGMQPLHHLAEWPGSPELMTLLVDGGADINATDGRGWTPLDYALDRGRKQMASALAEQGAVRSGTAA
jgi:hypothetical protein